MVIQNKILNSLFAKDELIRFLPTFSPEKELSGSGKKGFLIIIPEEEANEENLQLLSKILKAINVEINSDAFIFKANHLKSVNVSTIRQKVVFRQIFFFGVPLEKMGLNLTWKNYEPLLWNEFQILSADGLSKISKDEKLKRLLWSAVKNLKN